MSGMTIGRLAEAASVGVETVRFYQRRGLLSVPHSAGAVRRYDAEDLRRLRFIRRAATAGFTLADIAELIRLTQRKTALARLRWPLNDWPLLISRLQNLRLPAPRYPG